MQPDFLHRLRLGYRMEVDVEFPHPETGRLYVSIPNEPLSRFAGYDGLRRRLWDSAPVRRKGLRWLPELVAYTLIVPHASLGEFRRECEGLLLDAGEMAADAGCEPELVVQCVTNFLNAVHLAEERGGNVRIG